MRVIEMRVGRSALGETLGAMREWIDRKKAGAVKCETETDPSGLVLIRLEFGRAELGFSFQREWQVAAINAGPVAA